MWFSEPVLKEPGKRVASGSLTNGAAGVMVSSLSEFIAEMQDTASVGFVDRAAFTELSGLEQVPSAVIAIATEPLAATLAWLKPHAWLAHVASASMLTHPLAPDHFANVWSAITQARPRMLDWVDDDVEGRRVRMANSDSRIERLERMRVYLADKGVSPRTIDQLADAAEELLTNAFYDAPVSAGVAAGPISRETPVTLPDSAACDLAYGARGDLAIVRVKDPFGSLSRRRLVDVLTRCSRTDMQVEVDETMGGAGLGLWRIFSAATFVAVAVIEGVQTDILVGIGKRTNPKPFAFHLFFTDGQQAHAWKATHDETVDVGPTVRTT